MQLSRSRAGDVYLSGFKNSAHWTTMLISGFHASLFNETSTVCNLSFLLHLLISL